MLSVKTTNSFIRRRLPWRLSRLKVQHCHGCSTGCCCVTGSIPGPGTSTCCGGSQKLKKKNHEKRRNGQRGGWEGGEEKGKHRAASHRKRQRVSRASGGFVTLDASLTVPQRKGVERCDLGAPALGPRGPPREAAGLRFCQAGWVVTPGSWAKLTRRWGDLALDPQPRLQGPNRKESTIAVPALRWLPGVCGVRSWLPFLFSSLFSSLFFSSLPFPFLSFFYGPVVDSQCGDDFAAQRSDSVLHKARPSGSLLFPYRVSRNVGQRPVPHSWSPRASRSLPTVCLRFFVGVSTLTPLESLKSPITCLDHKALLKDSSQSDS